MCSSKSVCWWVWWRVCITSEPVSLMILCFSESVRWWICVTSEPVSLMNFCSRLNIRIGSMSKMITLYDCNIWTLECEHMYSWSLFDDELCDYRMQMYWFVTIDVLSGAVKTGFATEQGHPIGGAGRWLSPSSYVMLIYEMFYYECHNIALIFVLWLMIYFG